MEEWSRLVQKVQQGPCVMCVKMGIIEVLHGDVLLVLRRLQ